MPGGYGEQFLAEPKAHDITEGLVGEKNRDLKILMTAAPLAVARAARARRCSPADLLVTSADAFGMTDFFAWAEKGGPPEANCRRSREGHSPGDGGRAAEKGERARSHGPRMVVVGTASVALGQSWQERVLRGGAIFTEKRALLALRRGRQSSTSPTSPRRSGRASARVASAKSCATWSLHAGGGGALGAAVYLRRRVQEGEERPQEPHDEG